MQLSVTVNTDARDGSQQARQNLFPTVVLVLCFLLDVLKVHKGCPTCTIDGKSPLFFARIIRLPENP